MDPFRDLTRLLADAGDKHSVPELLVLVILPALLSFGLYRVARARVQGGASKRIVWLSLVPLLIGDWLGLSPLMDVNRESYRDFYYLTDRAINLHYAAFIAPALCTLVLLAMLGVGVYRDRMER